MDRSDRYLASLSEEGRYRVLIEAVTDYAIYMLDPEGRIAAFRPERPRGHHCLRDGSTHTGG